MVDPQTDDGSLRPPCHAWVDESIHVPVADFEGLYTLAAVLAAPDRCPVIREALRHLTPAHAERLHWREDQPSVRAAAIDLLREGDIAALAVTCIPLDARNQERARRKCMERLLFELDQRTISHVWVETRTQSLNSKDLRLIDALRGSGAISKRLRVEFARPLADPMLWLPDAVAGAVSHARKAWGTEYRDGLNPVLHEIIIAP